MALRNGCSPIGRLARLATAALISASALLVASAPAEAHHYRHYYRYHAPVARPAHYAHAAHYARAAHYPRYAHRGRVHAVRQAAAAVPGSPAFSALVVDANSGQTLYSADENGLRHPASITKVMTLYLLFEKLDQGAMTLRTQIPISEHAAAQEPSKLGLRPGETISVEDAIKAVVTRSANDVAVAISEAVGQTEDNFADMMTRKAHELGMSSTLYRNASGLPNDEQVTTAHDLTILGRALEERFPRYFHYFSTAEFDYDGEVIGNHNHLLGRVDGVDGIKTGYTRASGFNLLTSVHRDGRSLIAVVMGGRSAAGRDRIMQNLIADHLAEASTARTATVIADAAPDPSAGRPRRAAGPRPRGAPRLSASPNGTPEPSTGEGDNADGDDETAAPVADRDRRRPRPPAHPADPAAGRAPRRRGGVGEEDRRPAGSGERAGHAARTAARPRARPPSPAIAGARTDDQRRARSAQGSEPGRGSRRRRLGGARKLDDPDRRDRRPRQGERPFDPRPRTQRRRPSPRPSRSPRPCAWATARFTGRDSRCSIRRPPNPPAAPSNATDLPVSPPATDSPSKPSASQEPCLALSLHQNILGLIDPRGKRGRAAMIWMKLFHQGSMGADDVGRARAFGETQNFERLLARHRPAGAALPPPLRLTLVCLTPAGEPAVEIRL